MNSQKILFISHDSNRTGAPILLLRFIKMIADNPNYQCHILTGTEGPLLKEFQNTCETYIFSPAFRLKSDGLNFYFTKFKIIKPFLYLQKQNYNKALKKQLKQSNYDLIVANTIASSSMVQFLDKLGYQNIVSYIHELEFGLNSYVSKTDKEYLLKKSKYFWVPSFAVKNNLVKNHYLEPSAIDVLISANPTQNLSSLAIKSKKTTKIIGGVGTFDKRKGADIFVEIAIKTIQSLKENVIFEWYGADLNNDFTKKLLQKVKDLKLEYQIFIYPNIENILAKIAEFDIFLMPSREDPYPLVILEAALLEVPIIAFDENAGGTFEFIQNGAGVVVPYLNFDQMTKECIELLNNDAKKEAIVKTAKNKVVEKHSSEKSKNSLLQLLNKALNL